MLVFARWRRREEEQAHPTPRPQNAKTKRLTNVMKRSPGGGDPVHPRPRLGASNVLTERTAHSSCFDYRPPAHTNHGRDARGESQAQELAGSSREKEGGVPR